MMQVLYNNIKNFIEFDHLLPEKVYQQFETPALLNPVTLKLKYVYNYIWRQWFDRYSYSVSDFFRDTIVYDGKNMYKTFHPHLGNFFKLHPVQ